MWKKIVIASAVPFVASTYIFFQTDDAIKAPEGEIAYLNELRQAVAEKYKDYDIDRYTKRFAEVRTQYFQEQKTDLDNQKDALDAEDAQVLDNIAGEQATLAAAEEEYQRMKDELSKFLKEAASTVGLDEGDDADLSMIADKIAELITANEELEKQIAVEEAQIAALNAESDKLLKQIADGKKLNQDRQARLSPVELDCRVRSVDPQWSFITLDSGIDRGIVIGSRLAVMRGEDKICELNVKVVESSSTICDVVHSTLKPGEQVRAGDRVVSVRNNK